MKHADGIWSKILAIIIVLVALLTSMASSSSERKQANRHERIDIGMLVLLASPARYDGARIRTNGFLHLGFEENALYFHEEDYMHGLTKNALALDLSPDQAARFKDLSGKYVLIEGTVSASQETIERGLWSGVLGAITRVEAWPKK